MRRFAFLLLFLAIVNMVSAETELGVEGTRFTINGEATFLLGISYYGGLGASKEFILQDLQDMQKAAVNWIRVWVTWAAFDNDVSAVDAKGNTRNAYLDKLRWLVTECDKRGIVVDVTLSRGNGITGASRLGDLESLKRAARTLVSSLKPLRNWYLDIANERNIRDARFVSVEELAEVRKLVRQLDSKRLVTASHAGDMKRDELRDYVFKAKVDFISPHRPRNARSPGQTADQTRKYLAWMKELGRIVPVHYQEPFRRGFSPRRWEPKAEDFLTDLKQAKEGGAAGWCLHNGDQKDKPEGKPRRSFDMRDTRLFDQLDDEERKFLRELDKTRN
jgi:endo-1,4-beta-mannosidase